MLVSKSLQIASVSLDTNNAVTELEFEIYNKKI